MVVDPATGDVLATRVTDSDGDPGGEHHPQVIRLSSNDGGATASSVSVILDMPGETQGQSHQISSISIGPDGKLFVHNGDGFDASTALDLDSYRGKILRMNLDGTAPADNPFYNAANGINARDYVFAYGFRNPFGGAWRESDDKLYEVENGNALDRLARVDQGGNYDWNGGDTSLLADARYVWNPAHAPVNIAFVQPETFGGSHFPAALFDRAFVSESGPTYASGPQSRGKRIVQFELDAAGDVVGGPNTLVEYVGAGRGHRRGTHRRARWTLFQRLVQRPRRPDAHRPRRPRLPNPLHGCFRRRLERRRSGNRARLARMATRRVGIPVQRCRSGSVATELRPWRSGLLPALDPNQEPFSPTSQPDQRN